VVPVFNGERYIAEALDSILAQTYARTEIVVADDGSTDGTWRVVERYGERIRFVTQPTAGPAATRNLGLRTSTGELVAFLDSDDLWHQEKLERQVRRFREKPELQACVTHVQMFWVPELKEEQEQYVDNPRTSPVPGYATTTLLTRREIFGKVGDFRTDLWFSDATEWFMRARERAVVMELLPDVLTFHRMHESNLTRRRLEASRAEFARIVKEHLDRRRRVRASPASGNLPHASLDAR
jgi:glycosyltransferase involved in cell wall biosynthesis